MSEGIKTVIYPASDLARAQIFSEFADEFEATHERYLQS